VTVSYCGPAVPVGTRVLMAAAEPNSAAGIFITPRLSLITSR